MEADINPLSAEESLTSTNKSINTLIKDLDKVNQLNSLLINQSDQKLSDLDEKSADVSVSPAVIAEPLPQASSMAT